MPVLSLNINTKNLIGKIKSRAQLCRVYTEDGRMVVTEPAVLKGSLSDDDKLAGWLLDPDELVQDLDSGLWYQLLDERSIYPVPAVSGVQKIKDGKSLLEQIFKDSVAIDIATINEESLKEKQKTWWFIIFGAPILLAALILGIKVIQG